MRMMMAVLTEQSELLLVFFIIAVTISVAIAITVSVAISVAITEIGRAHV